MATYLTYDDIKANIAKGFQLEPYLEEADNEIIDLAESLGVRDSSDIENNPLHYKIKRFGIVFCLMRLCQDKIGTNNVQVADLEKYVVNYNMYRKELQELRGQISIEMVTGHVNEIRDRANIMTGTIFRG